MTNDKVICPICDSEMRPLKRKTDGKEFWGCKKWPNCKGTRNKGDEKKVYVTKYKPITLMPGSDEQEAIWDYMLNGRGHIVINAGPGVGKTWVGVQGCLRLPKTLKIFFIAFNKHIADEANGKLLASKCGNVDALTFHGLGLRIIRSNHPGAVINDNKMTEILEGQNPMPLVNVAEWRRTLNLAEKLCGFVKNYNLDYEAPDFKTELERIADHHGTDLNGVYPQAFPLIAPALDTCKKMVDVSVDFDDMIWLPVTLKLFLNSPCDILFTDESQDLNVVQHELIFHATKRDSRVFVVGDRRQSIYGFRGAHTSSIDELKKRLAATRKGVREFPMTITRRCPKLHVQLAQAISPEIRALEDAPLGEILQMDPKKAVEEMKAGDMVMCRVNAPLINAAYALIKRGIRPILKGRDLGDGLLALLEKLAKKIESSPREMHDLRDALTAYRWEQESKLSALGDKAKGRIAALADKCDCMNEFIANSTSINDMRMRIATIFEKSNDSTLEKGDEQGATSAVVLGTVHRTKGLEAERVFILAPELIPHPAAKQKWETDQETNIAWVACTRAKFNNATGAPGTLVFCGDIPSIYSAPIAPEEVEEVEQPDPEGVPEPVAEIEYRDTTGIPSADLQWSRKDPVREEEPEDDEPPF